MASECCNSFGGRISIEIDGIRYSARGDITIEPTNLEVAAESNHDGSIFYTSKPKPFRAAMSFSQPCGLRWNDAVRRCSMNVTITEDDNGRTHLFGNARWVGMPSYNISTGEVTGLTIAGPNYQVLEDA